MMDKSESRGPGIKPPGISRQFPFAILGFRNGKRPKTPSEAYGGHFWEEQCKKCEMQSQDEKLVFVKIILIFKAN